MLLHLRQFSVPNVSVHQIRPTRRPFTNSITFPMPVNKLPINAVGFGWHVLFATVEKWQPRQKLRLPLYLESDSSCSHADAHEEIAMAWL